MKHTLQFALAGVVLAGLTVSAAPVDWSKLPPAATKANVSFADDILPILKASCVRCHGANQPRAQLNLSTLEGVLKGARNAPVVKSGDSANSLLVKSVSQLDPQSAMPPKPRPPRRAPGGAQGTNAPAMDVTNAPAMPPRMAQETKPLTPEQVGLIRAWIDQGAK